MQIPSDPEIFFDPANRPMFIGLFCKYIFGSVRLVENCEGGHFPIGRNSSLSGKKVSRRNLSGRIPVQGDRFRRPTPWGFRDNRGRPC